MKVWEYTNILHGYYKCKMFLQSVIADKQHDRYRSWSKKSVIIKSVTEQMTNYIFKKNSVGLKCLILFGFPVN